MKTCNGIYGFRYLKVLLLAVSVIVTVPALSAGAPIKIGDQFGGGIVAYVMEPGDPGYAEAAEHFLIIAKADLSETFDWSESKAASILLEENSIHDRYMRIREIPARIADSGH